MLYFITGTAGFIGFHLAKSLLEKGEKVVGLDSFTPYYPVVLKQARHRILKEYPQFIEQNLDLCDLAGLEKCFLTYSPQIVCHLAAQPGVRYSLQNPFSYQKSNLEAFLNILEMARHHHVQRLVYASSSSVYGKSEDVPYRESARVDTPISLYAATKKANELMAYTYTHLYGLQTIGLRFFTVYGPWGRPDMAIWKFTDAIACGKEIEVFNYGDTSRDFTYVDDIVKGIEAALTVENLAPYEIFNLGNNHPENIRKVISLLEKEMGKKAQIQLKPLQPGDMITTFADTSHAGAKLQFASSYSLEKGIANFVSWYQQNESLIRQVREMGCLG